MDFENVNGGMEPQRPSAQPEAAAEGFAPQETYEQPAFEQPATAWTGEESFPPRKEKKAANGIGKRVLAAALALVILAGSCGITAAVVSARWEKRIAAVEESFADQLELVQSRFESKLQVLGEQDNAATTPVAGKPAATTGAMTPGQVYENNVSSVVLIYNEVTSSVLGQSGTSTGSGFIISGDGYVVTNHHVIEGGGKLTVITSDGGRYDAELIGSDATNDVALLKVEAEGLKAAAMGSSGALAVGDQVAAIGNPLGDLTSTMTVGYVSAKERDVSTEGTIISMIQTDAAINSGNSGGPLFNMNGEVVGITTAKFSGTTASGASIEGIGFAIPIDDVKEILEDLLKYGYVRSAYLGVMVRNMTSTEIANAELFGATVGVYVESVEKGNCAYAAGLKSRDIIIEIGGYEVETMSDLSRALRHLEPGQTTTITVQRSGKIVTLSITLDEKPRETATTTPTVPETVPEFGGDMPSDGSFEEWYDYFYPFFGEGQD